MKKILTFALCGLSVLAAGAQKTTVEQAKKLAGKLDKIEEARNLIIQAIQNPETANQADTYYIGGKVEWDAFDKNMNNMAINPEKVNPLEMGMDLLNGFDLFMKVFELDQLPNEKGEVKPKYTKDLQKKIVGKADDFFQAGSLFFETKQFPLAYDAFMIYGDLPEMKELGAAAPAMADTVRAVAYFNAGLSAWSAGNVNDAAGAFKKARENNYTDPNACLYEIACWQNIQQSDSTRLNEAMNNIYGAAMAGYEKFGIEQPVFITNMVNTMVNSDRNNDALALVNDAISKNPDSAVMYGLRGFVYDRMENDDAALADYIRAAEMPDVDHETLKNASRKLFKIGQNKLNEINYGDPNTPQLKAQLKNDYFVKAKAYADKAKQLKPDDTAVDYILENIDYVMSQLN